MKCYRIIKKDFDFMESLYYPQYKRFLIWWYFIEDGKVKKFHYLDETKKFIRDDFCKDEEKKPIKKTIITEIW